MKLIIFTFFLIGAVFASPISFSAVSLSSELDSNSTESLSVSQSSENDTSELQSSEENISSLSSSSESQSDESTSEDTTSEESNSESEEEDGSDSLAETRDDSMGSEENVRKRVQVFASVLKVLSAEDNSSTEVKSLSAEVTEKQQKMNLAQGHTDPQLVGSTSDSSDSTSESADTSENTEETAAASNSSESKESNETNETSEDSDSASRSEEDSNASDSGELQQVKDCVNGTQSCESEEYFFNDIGDDGHYSVDNLMVPDDGEREFMLRR